jgi:hypothetical protein
MTQMDWLGSAVVRALRFAPLAKGEQNARRDSVPDL